MPVIRTLAKVAQQALLSNPSCGCQPLTVAVRNISFSPRQVTSDASFHSVSFSETDHPKVLITGNVCSFSHMIELQFEAGLFAGVCAKGKKKKKCRQYYLTFFFPFSAFTL